MKRAVVIAYDISDTRTRNEVSTLLKPFGDRINKSVFECMVTDRQLEGLREKLRRYVVDDSDRIVFYCLCRECIGKREVIGKKDEQRHMVVFV